MSFKDYKKFSKNKENKEQEIPTTNEQTDETVNNNVEPEVNETVNNNVEPELPELPEDNNVEPEVEKTIVKTKGIVNAAKLNVRKEASKDADVLTVISKGTGVGINLTESTEDFYCVDVIVNSEMTTGYCMKEFISTSK